VVLRIVVLRIVVLRIMVLRIVVRTATLARDLEATSMRAWASILSPRRSKHSPRLKHVDTYLRTVTRSLVVNGTAG